MHLKIQKKVSNLKPKPKKSQKSNRITESQKPQHVKKEIQLTCTERGKTLVSEFIVVGVAPDWLQKECAGCD